MQAERQPADWPALARRYYLTMAIPFAIDGVITLIVASIVDYGGIIPRNLLTSGIFLLAGLHLAARWRYAPIAASLAAGIDMKRMEASLTQLPLHSAMYAGGAYLVVVASRMFPPLLFGVAIPFGRLDATLLPTWLDAVLTTAVSGGFMFVVIYFRVSDFLEALCTRVFEANGANLGLFYGRFGLKIGVAMVFSALAPLLLIAGDVASYSGDRLVSEIGVDIAVSLYGLAALLFWAVRTLGRPLARLDEGMKRAAAGDLTVRLPVTSNEEIGALTDRFNRMVEGLRERERLRETFGKYVSESVASELLREAPDGHLEGRTAEATLMFTDIEGFTTLSERLAPSDVIRLLNEYLPRVVEPIQRHGGVVNGFIGDGLFASFNMPLAADGHAARAVAAARDIQKALADFRTQDGHALVTRIGINTGSVVGGTIGSGERLSYTLLGDAVNAAARLEALNKAHGTRILLSDATREAAGDGHEYRFVGEVTLRGKSGTLRVFTLAD
ncbi:MAG: adenylate/guanylate cyclase domain-containing protein [Proteobacteria bacterium]|nr:adenylate/guanylate cyclase domain-containing protein [Pseudomonadota bacterium]